MKHLLYLCIFTLTLLLAPYQLHAESSSVVIDPSTATTGSTEDDFMDEDPFDDFDDVKPLEVYDPIETINRGTFWLNDKLYFYIFKPIAKGFRVIPEGGRVSLSNFFSNLGAPIRFINSLLQLKIEESGKELGRFAMNTTTGFFGFFDPASENGLPKSEEDMGQTLGHYGISSGPYLVLPVFGPSNLRDGIGKVGDYFLDPLNHTLNSTESFALKAVDTENALSLDKDTYEGIVKHELDPYLFIRDAYEQNRAANVKK